MAIAGTSAAAVQLESLLQVSLGQPVMQVRARPIRLGGGARGFLLAYCADFDVDPYIEMFFFPTDTLKLAVFDDRGERLWCRDLGRGVVPGMHFCPIQTLDLDGDGADEVWFVNNLNTQHPLGVSGYRLERLDGRSGRTLGQWPWPALDTNQSLSHTFRNFIVGGQARGEPVLVTAQGTYGDMALQAYRPDMSSRWEYRVRASDKGARGSHMAAVADINDDGVDELMWGERCLELAGGRELFCCDRETYRGHSDVVLPFRDEATGAWFIYTCRESDPKAAPRVATFDARGQRVWGAVDQGHMDMGWVARLGDDRRRLAMAIRIGRKTCGPDGRFHQERTEFVFDALTGTETTLPFSVYGTRPVDLDGDGYDELVYGIPGQDGRVIDRHGRDLGSVSGTAALTGKLLDHPGNQILVYQPDGTLRVWGAAAP
ncbi:MAG: polysaccharide lyase 11 [Lentisphaeria bacterium]|nr:polysaccharide lyase 11 [Lentisphaeria bacterium]